MRESLRRGQQILTMKTYRKELWFNLPTRVGFVNLTPDVEQCVVASTVQEGFDNEIR